MQTVRSLSKPWKEVLKNDNENSNHLITQDHNRIKKQQRYSLSKLEIKET